MQICGVFEEAADERKVTRKARTGKARSAKRTSTTIPQIARADPRTSRMQPCISSMRASLQV
jgi:hypothetical protein